MSKLERIELPPAPKVNSLSRSVDLHCHQKRRFGERLQTQESLKNRPIDIRNSFLTLHCAVEIELLRHRLNWLKYQLSTLNDCLQGQYPLTATFCAVAEALGQCVVPDSWPKINSADETILSSANIVGWTENLYFRSKFIEDWNARGPPKQFWLAALACPQRFLELPFRVRHLSEGCEVLSLHLQGSVQWEIPKKLDEASILLNGFVLKNAYLNRERGVLEKVRNELAFLISNMPL